MLSDDRGEPSGIGLLNLSDALAIRHTSNRGLEELHPVAGKCACLV